MSYPGKTKIYIFISLHCSLYKNLKKKGMVPVVTLNIIIKVSNACITEIDKIYSHVHVLHEYLSLQQHVKLSKNERLLMTVYNLNNWFPTLSKK